MTVNSTFKLVNHIFMTVISIIVIVIGCGIQ